MTRQVGRRLAAAAVGGVWLYHGLWCKLLGGCPEQVDVVASVPGLRGRRAKAVLLAIGVAETALAVWVVSGKRPRGAATLGTTLVVGMNAGGLTFGRQHIPAAKTMLTENAVFLALAWLAAEQDARAAEG